MSRTLFIAFRVDNEQFLTEGGNIRRGNLARYWRREVIQWHNTATLVDLYNEFLEDTYGSVSIRWWQRMEKENRFPQDVKRRWVIATLLNISPAYLGLTALAPLIPRLEILKISPTAKPGPLDVVAYYFCEYQSTNQNSRNSLWYAVKQYIFCSRPDQG